MHMILVASRAMASPKGMAATKWPNDLRGQISHKTLTVQPQLLRGTYVGSTSYLAASEAMAAS